MAEFGINAASLQGPSFAGSSPIDPVQRGGRGPVVPLGGLGILADVGVDYAKQAAKSNSPIGKYSKYAGGVAQAIDSGQISAREGQDRIRQFGAELLASSDDPELAQNMKKAWDGFFGVTSLSVAAQDEEDERSSRKAQMEEARKRGLIDPYSNPSEAQKAAASQLVASLIQQEEAAKALQAQMEEQRKQEAHGMARNRYDMDAYSFSEENNVRLSAQKSMGEAVKFMAASFQAVEEQMNAGTISYEEGREQLSATFAQYKAIIGSELLGDQRTSQTFVTLLDETQAAWNRSKDPTTAGQQATNLFNTQMARLKYAAITTDPKLRDAAVLSVLLPNVPLSTSQTTQVVSDWVVKAERGGSPILDMIGVADPSVEREVYGTVMAAVRNLKSSTTNNPEEVITGASTATNKILKNMTRIGADPDIGAQTFAEVTRYIASPEFAEIIRAGQLDMPAMAAAKQAWENKYQETVLRKVVPTLNTVIGENGEKAFSMVDFEFKNGKLDVVSKIEGIVQGQPNNPKTLGPRLRARAEIQDFTRALNLLITTSAHMEGRTDYEAYWEERKSQLLPDFFPSPQKEAELRAQGYTGGNYRNPANYRRNDGNTRAD